ncbi:MAG: IS630 family transposase, partial [Candidatus Riflebacteria bacterium]|nr:IS630 family transposase [Candidatus Riflebacteria bacterium]
MKSRTESAQKIERARMILLSCEGKGVSEIARILSTNRPKVDLTLNKVLEFGFESALADLPRSGRSRRITDDARQWITSLACQKPTQLGYPHEMWTHALLAQHARDNCCSAGYPALSNLGKSTVTKILAASDIHPHKIRYYLERRDPEFDAKMADVLVLYKEVEILREEGLAEGMDKIAVVSYDEKPGVQAIDTTAPDLPPEPGKHPCVSRDHEYKRLGTISVLAGIDLMSGYVHYRLEDRHRSCEFVQFLKAVNEHYSGVDRIRVLLDNHSAHISQETRKYLASVPNRFDFIFTPKHASWL